MWGWFDENCLVFMWILMVEVEIVWGGCNEIFKNFDLKLWLDCMGEKGWIVLIWLKEYGGGGLFKEENKIF